MEAEIPKHVVTVYLSAHSSTIYKPRITRSKTVDFNNVTILSSTGEKLIPSEMGIIIHSKEEPKLNGLTTEIATFTELNKIYKDDDKKHQPHKTEEFHREKLEEIKERMQEIDTLAEITYRGEGYKINKPVNNKSYTFTGNPYELVRKEKNRSNTSRLRGQRRHNIVWCVYGIYFVSSSIEEHQQKSIASMNPTMMGFDSSAFPACMLDPTHRHFEKSNLLNYKNYTEYWRDYIDNLPITPEHKEQLKDIIKTGIKHPHRLDLTDIIYLLKGLGYDIIFIVDPTCNTLRVRQQDSEIVHNDTQDLSPVSISSVSRQQKRRKHSNSPSSASLVITGGGNKKHKHKYSRNLRTRRRINTRRRMR